MRFCFQIMNFRDLEGSLGLAEVVGEKWSERAGSAMEVTTRVLARDVDILKLQHVVC